MNNQDMPASPIGEQIDGIHMNPKCNGETKREKAFWMTYNNMLMLEHGENYESIASQAIEAVNAGFKALEQE